MVVILFGVTGSGKTTVGELLASELNWKFYDADDFHPAANIAKLHAGIALTDADRKPWLDGLHDLIKGILDRHENGVLACSALKEEYRAELTVDARVVMVYLEGDYHLIEERLAHRHNHFMNPNLLQSQFDTLEEPQNAITVDITPAPDTIVRNIRTKLGV